MSSTPHKPTYATVAARDPRPRLRPVASAGTVGHESSANRRSFQAVYVVCLPGEDTC